MDKKASIGLVILIAVVFFIFGMLIFNLIKPDVTRVRTNAELNCTGMPDTSGDKITCLIVDGIIPMIILGILSISIGYVVDRGLK